MRTIIFIGLNKSGSSREAVKAANGLGYYTVVFTDQEKQIQQRSEYNDVHQLTFVDTKNTEELREQIRLLQQRGHEIVVITSFVDNYVLTASSLADEFCKNLISTEAISIMENKEKTRTFFSNQTFTPKFKLVKKDIHYPFDLTLQTFHFPVVVKFASSTGSKDVILATNMRELEKNVRKLRTKNQKKQSLLKSMWKENKT